MEVHKKKTFLRPHMALWLYVAATGGSLVRLICSILLCLVATSVYAGGRWIVDSKTGCKVWNPFPVTAALVILCVVPLGFPAGQPDWPGRHLVRCPALSGEYDLLLWSWQKRL